MSKFITIARPQSYTIDTLAAAQAAHFTYRGGPLLSSVQVVTLFWGSGWQSDLSYQSLISNLNTFFTSIVKSPLIDQLAEYNANSYTIKEGSFAGTATLADPFPLPSFLGQTLLFDFMIQHFIEQKLGQHTLPAATPNTLYFVFLPPGVTVCKNWEFSCANFCGYHGTTSNQTYYAVMPYPSCQACSGGMLPFDALTTTSSHELCEAITDPIPGQGWYDNQYGEIGDICAWKTKEIGQYTVQREWSQANLACA